jgi:hypothetical protein
MMAAAWGLPGSGWESQGFLIWCELFQFLGRFVENQNKFIQEVGFSRYFFRFFLAETVVVRQTGRHRADRADWTDDWQSTR